MDPVTAVGLALSVAGIAGQVFKGCIQGIQFIITAKNLPEDSKYLNLRLRMEQQRLFAWSETSGLLDLDASNEEKIRDSNTFIVHRTTILDLLVQIKCLFEEFEKAQRRNKNLQVSPEPAVDDVFIEDPAEDSSSAHVPLPKRRRDFIIKAMKAVKSNTTDPLMEGRRRLVWAAFQKDDFEGLLQRFSTLNDNMTDILDARLQTEIHRTTQDTNRGVLQLHKNIASLHQLVMALNIKLQAQSYPITSSQQYSSASEAAGLRLLAQLAKFKAFNESMDVDKNMVPWDEATAKVLQLGQPDIEQASIKIDRSSITLLGPSTRDSDVARCEALYDHNGYKQRVWIEWKEYELQDKGTSSPPPIIIDRVQKLAALLHHSPKPEAFRVPHCLGYFHNTIHSTGTDTDSDGEEDGEARIGFVFERPQTEDILPDTPPISLFDLLSSSKRPRVTDRIKLAHAISNCLLYLHSVNWLHKGLRSHNIVFFPVTKEKRTLIDYSKPYLSGFDFARPARKDEMTEVPWDVPEYNLYRHPSTQSNAGFGSREGFRKSFDIYSLGVVLIELAHWATIDRVLGIPKGKVRATGKIREVLLDKERIADVGANMGEVFEGATRKCIAGGKELGIDEGDDETSDTVAAKLGYHFYEEVVKRLGDVKV